jgi:hypothetical protein
MLVSVHWYVAVISLLNGRRSQWHMKLHGRQRLEGSRNGRTISKKGKGSEKEGWEHDSKCPHIAVGHLGS